MFNLMFTFVYILNGEKLVGDLSVKIVERTGDPRSSVQMFQVKRLAIAIQRGNAAGVMTVYSLGGVFD